MTTACHGHSHIVIVRRAMCALRPLEKPKNTKEGFFFLEIQQSEIKESGQGNGKENMKVKHREKKRKPARKKRRKKNAGQMPQG